MENTDMFSETLTKIITYYLQYMPLLLVVGSIFGTVCLAIISFIFKIIPEKYVVLAIIASVVLVIYAVIFQKNSSKKTLCDSPSTYNINNKLPIISHRSNHGLKILFVFGMVLLLLILQFTNSRPVFYFVICSILTAILAILILFAENKKSTISLILYIGTYSFLTTFAIFKYYFWLGTDTWTHATWNEVIANMGTMSVAYGKEIGYPIQHIAVAIGQLLPQVDVRVASLLAVSISSVLLSILVYVTMRKFVGEKLGLFSYLLINICGHVIYWRILSQTTSYGSILILLLLWLCIAYSILSEKQFRPRYFLLYIFCLAILCITHVFSTFIFIFMLIGIYVGSIIFFKKLITRELILLVIGFLVMMVVWISVSFGLISATSIVRDKLFMTSDILESGVVSLASYVNITPPSIIQSILGSPESIVFIVVMPFLYLSIKCLTQHSKQSHFLQIISLSYFFCMGACGVSLFLGSGMSGRFTVVLELFSVMAIVYLCYDIIVKINRRKILTGLLIALCVFVGVFTFINIPYQGLTPDNPIWVKGSVNTDGVLLAEFMGVKTITNYIPASSAPINIDGNNIGSLLRYLLFNKQLECQNLIPAIGQLPYTYQLTDWLNLSNQGPRYLIFRDILISTPLSNRVSLSDGDYFIQTLQLTISEISTLDETNNCLYTNGGLSCYFTS